MFRTYVVHRTPAYSSEPKINLLEQLEDETSVPDKRDIETEAAASGETSRGALLKSASGRFFFFPKANRGPTRALAVIDESAQTVTGRSVRRDILA